MFELLAQQQRAALVVAADEAAAARLVSLPMVEIRPSVPNRPLLLLLLALVIPGAVILAVTCRILLRGTQEWPPSGPGWTPSPTLARRERAEPVLTRTPAGGDGAC